MKGHREQDQVLPITLTEVIILLFFALALAFVWNARELTAVPEEIREPFVSGSALEPEPGWSIIVRCIEGVDVCDPGAAPVLVEIARDLGIRTEGARPSELADSIKRQIEAARAAADTALMEDGQDPEAARGPGPITRIVQAFRGQGDFPPCWADYSTGRREIIYAFDVTLFSDIVRFRRRWPVSHDDSAAAVPGITPLADAELLPYPRFRELAAPVLRWSNAHDPPCRHYVVIHDSVSGGDEKEDFKQNLLTVEGYFYKNLVLE
jgi:hypothetical protein